MSPVLCETPTQTIAVTSSLATDLGQQQVSEHAARLLNALIARRPLPDISLHEIPQELARTDPDLSFDLVCEAVRASRDPDVLDALSWILSQTSRFEQLRRFALDAAEDVRSRSCFLNGAAHMASTSAGDRLGLVRELLADPAPEIREDALLLLEASTPVGPEERALVRQLGDEDPDPHVRRTASEVLESLEM